VIQQGQVLQAQGEGRGWAAAVGLPVSARRTKFGSAAGGRVRDSRGSTEGAPEALRKALDRVCPGRGGATTLAGLVEEYLQLRQAEPVTIAKLRWLLGKATAALGQVALSALSPKDVYAIPHGNRWQPVATDSACFSGFEGQPICR
jgi:hypothetical protein